jgi:cephalosporin-C deacetylase-like acetyl esterase
VSRRFCFIFWIAFLFNPILLAQPHEHLVEVIVATDHPDWQSKLGKKVKFTIFVLQYENDIASRRCTEMVNVYYIGLQNFREGKRLYEILCYLGCVRAFDFIFSLPQFDGEKLAVTGGSQGRGLSIVTAALDSRVKWLVPIYPALCDLTGYLYGGAGGWPHIFDKTNYTFIAKKDKIETSKYYDVVNFARQVKVPGFYFWGFNDIVCLPTSMYAAYNVITAPKQLLLV